METHHSETKRRVKDREEEKETDSQRTPAPGRTGDNPPTHTPHTHPETEDHVNSDRERGLRLAKHMIKTIKF